MRKVVVLVLLSLSLSGCALQDAREHALLVAQVEPLSGSNKWTPGLALGGYEASGLGPDGYPGVVETGGPSPTQKFLASIGLRNGDLADGSTIELLPKGNLLSVPTLDFCNGTYATEKQRISRRQVGSFDISGAYTGFSSEAVQYESPEAALAALAELKAQKKQCPDGTTFTDGDGVDHKLTFHPAPGPSNTELMTDFVVLHELDKASDGNFAGLYVWQVRGNTLIALYASQAQAKPLDQTSLDYVYSVVSKLTLRLKNADPVNVGYL